MFQTKYTRENGRVILQFVSTQRGLLPFKTKVEEQSLRDWSSKSDASGSLAHAEISRLIEEMPTQAVETQKNLILYDKALAQLSNNALTALALPQNPSFTFKLEQKGSLATGDLQIKPRWKHQGQYLRINKDGVFMTHEGVDYIIPNPIFEIYSTIEEFQTKPNQDTSTQMKMVAEVLDLVRGPDISTDPFDNALHGIPTEEQSPDLSKRFQVQLDEVLSKFSVKTARAISFDVSFKNKDGYNIKPVLFGKVPATSQSQISEKQGLLSKNERLIFESDPKKGFFSSASTKSTYLLESGEYILIDQLLSPALELVRGLQTASADMREDFATNPAKAIAEVYRQQLSKEGADVFSDDLQEEQVETIISSIFIETQEYSDRVTELGLWVPPIVPWVKNKPNSWEPEEFGIHLGDQYINLPQGKIDDLREKIDDAIKSGIKTIPFEGQKIPATPEMKGIIDELIGLVKPTANPNAPKTSKGENPQTEHQVLIIKDNFDELRYRRELKKRLRYLEKNLSPEISTTLMDHQDVSLEWQIDSYLSGLPGVLNADDQGLGKTLQTIAFMAWLQGNMKHAPDSEKKPILVVAPTTLLKNWATEVETHMTSMFGLGSRIDAYGSSLQNLKKQTSNGSIYLDLGLNTHSENDRICWVLTTYQTLAQNQKEFGKIDFATVIFDEIQNIKNVKTLTHRAAQSMKADFTIGLTGTPVENDVSEIWAILDTIAPGSMGSLKHFLERFSQADENQYKVLHDEIFTNGYAVDPEGEKIPPLSIRRMKSEAIKNLPFKKYRFYPLNMPEMQAQAYDMVFARLKNEAQGRALKILHQLRSVSLYPGNLQQLNEQQDALKSMMDRSARIKAAVDIMDQIKERREKVLLFLETHEMQHLLRGLLAKRYGLEDIPILNGQTTPKRRGQIVDEFKETLRDGKFAIRILSPKSAGVGITMIAATNIIHLSRWWNPAIEEQCNDRIYRIGQEQNCTIHIPLAVHPHHQNATFDCILNDIMIRKRKLFQDVLMPSENSEMDQGTLIANMVESSFDLQNIDRMDWKEFENWSGRLAHQLGIWKVSQTPRVGDGGLDTHLEHKERKDIVLVQCKYTNNYEKLLGTAPVKEILHATERYDISNGHQCVVLTNAQGFDHHAKELALENNVILVDRHRLSLWPNHII